MQLVQNGKFREDLYYRLSTVPIRVPALHDRKEDIHLLFRKFAGDFADKYKTAPVQLDDEAKSLLINYPWPGNVRELKNIAEQISVLSQDKNIAAKELTRFLQPYSNNRLPVLAHANGSPQEFSNEREILYKLFFDMKKDVTELKRMFLEVLQNPNLVAQNPAILNELKELKGQDNLQPVLMQPSVQQMQPMPMQNYGTMNNDIHEHVEVEESLNIMDKEKELIIKALKKHKGKRKDAALDLGISERTLYRKLKEYDIEE